MTKHSPSAPKQQNVTANQADTRKPVHTFGLPHKQGMYDPRNEHDACGVGFVAHMKGEKSHQIVQDGLFMLENLTHRGAVGADPLMGDGAGMLMQIPHTFFKEELAKDGVELPEAGNYGVGYFFLTQDDDIRQNILNVITDTIIEEGFELITIRDVPVDNSSLSKDPEIAATEPIHHQIFVGRDENMTDDDEYERAIYTLRKVISNRLLDTHKFDSETFYPVSFSARTIVYKGMFLAYQVGAYYKDLADPHFESAVALVHQRFSTNTFPSWRLSHPYRMVAHNGEINTLRGNVNWMAARQASITLRKCGQFPTKANQIQLVLTMLWNS